MSADVASSTCDLFGEYLKNSPTSVTQLSIFLISGISYYVWHNAKFKSWLLQWKYVACGTVCWNNAAQPLICPLKFVAPSYVWDTVFCKSKFNPDSVLWISSHRATSVIDSHKIYSTNLSIGFPSFRYLKSRAICSLLLRSMSVTSSAWILNIGPTGCSLISLIISSNIYFLKQSKSSFCVVLEMYDAFFGSFAKCSSSTLSPASMRKSSKLLKLPWCFLSTVV